jgi:phosphatidylserine/phosphatidylglycerophosphate/cardiolipin synthase-like enzyme
MAWLTSSTLLQALQGVRQGVNIVVQKEAFLRSDIGQASRKWTRDLYAKLPSCIVGIDPEAGGTWVYRGEEASHDLFTPLGPSVKGIRCYGVHDLNAMRTDATPRMHHKFVIITMDTGETLTCFGSYNWTWTANHSLEDVVVIQDQAFAMSFEREFQAVFLRSEPLEWTSPDIDPDYLGQPRPPAHFGPPGSPGSSADTE